jgi:hypothetical protein
MERERRLRKKLERWQPVLVVRLARTKGYPQIRRAFFEAVD